MGLNRSNDNGGHKASDDVKTVTRSAAGTKHADVVQVPKGAKALPTTPAAGKTAKSKT